MKKLKIIGLSTALATSLFALQQPEYDYISISMGGVGVASSYGSMSSYLNPALIVNRDNKRTEFAIDLGIAIQEHELGDDLSKIDDSDVSYTLDEISKGRGDRKDIRDNANQITEALKSLAKKESNYLMLSPRAALSFKIGRHFSLGVFANVNAKIKAVIDESRLKYITKNDSDDLKYLGEYIKYDPNSKANAYKSSSETEYKQKSIEYAMKENNSTRLDLNGVSIVEIPLTIANSTQIGGFNIDWGVSAKYIQATTTSTKILFTDDDYDPTKELDKNKITTNTFGVDLGIVAYSEDSGFKFAISGKNLNTPEFDVENGAKYKLEPKITTGIAYSATDMIDLEIDYDLSTLTDELTNQKYRYIGAGINFHPLTWFSIRGGVRENQEDDYNGLIYSAGLSFGLKWLQLDVAVQVSENSGNYDGSEIPRYVNGNIAIVSKWGDN